MVNFKVEQRISNDPEKGERYFIVIEGISYVRAITMTALIIDVEQLGDKVLQGIREATLERVRNQMEVLNGHPSYRFPAKKGLTGAEQARRKFEVGYESLMEMDPQLIDRMGQRYEEQ